MHELRVTFYIRVTSCYLLQELRVNFYVQVTSYYLLHELRVKFIMRVTSYYLLHQSGLWCWLLKFLYNISYSFLWPALYKINYLFLVSYSWAMYFMKECSKIKLQSAIFSCVKFLYISMTYYLQHQVFLTSCYQLSNKVCKFLLQRCYNTTKLWHSNWKVGFWIWQEF